MHILGSHLIQGTIEKSYKCGAKGRLDIPEASTFLCLIFPFLLMCLVRPRNVAWGGFEKGMGKSVLSCYF